MNTSNQPPASLRGPMDDMASEFDRWRIHDGREYSNMLASEAVYDRQKAQYVAKPEYSHLRQAIEKYAAARADLNLKVDLGQPSWNSVFDCLDEATNVYEAKANNNPIRRRLRSPAVSENVKALAEALPTDDGLGLIKAGLLVIFVAVKRRSSTCESIFRYFASVPRILRKADEAVSRYKGDHALRASFENLIYHLTDSIPVLIDYLLRADDDSALQKATRVFSSAASDVIHAKLAEIGTLTSQLDQDTERLDRSLQHKSYVVAENTNLEAKDTRRALYRFEEINEKRHEALLAKLEEGNRTWAHFHMEQERAALALMSLKQEGVSMLNKVLTLVADMERTRAIHETTPTPTPPPIPRSSSQQVLEVVCGHEDPFVYNVDLNSVMQLYASFSEAALAQSTYMVTTREFQHWLLGPRSDLLLVEGHCSAEAIGRISPLSVLCAMFVTSRLRAAVSAETHASPIVLWTFCGERTDVGGSFAGPKGLVRSLIIQILLAWPQHAPLPSLDRLERIPALWTDIQHWDTNALCHLLHDLLIQLPRGCEVFCILDGISSFETELWDWERELLMVTQCLRDCVYDTARVSHGAVLKVLLTSPEKSISVAHCVDTHQQLDLRAGNYHGASQDYGSVMALVGRPA